MPLSRKLLLLCYITFIAVVLFCSRRNGARDLVPAVLHKAEARPLLGVPFRRDDHLLRSSRRNRAGISK